MVPSSDAIAEFIRWQKMTILHRWQPIFAHVASQLVANKLRYQSVSSTTAVPWAVIAVIHDREAGQSWKANLAQGDPWNSCSVHIPRGRGPFMSWEAAACDALLNCAPHIGRNEDWSIGGALTAIEAYNGYGYEKYHHMASPYLWSGTNQYTRGKYTQDGHFDPDAVDHQLGCAGLLKTMMMFDSSINFPDTVAYEQQSVDKPTSAG